MKVCFAQDGVLVCMVVPIHVDLRRPFEVDLPHQPRPEPPWLEHVGIDRHVIDDLKTLATLKEIASYLSPAMQKSVLEQIQRAASAMGLPAGVSVQP